MKGFAMKRFLLWCLSLSAGISVLSVLSMSAIQSHFVNVVCPGDIELNPGIPMYYRGDRSTIDQRFTYLKTGLQLYFSIIITERVKFPRKMCKNTLSCLELVPGLPVAWYDATLLVKPETDEQLQEAENPEDAVRYHWVVEKRTDEDLSKRIPEHAVVLLLPPDLVERVVDDPVAHTENRVALPAVVLKRDISQETLTQILEAIRVSNALDLDAVHKHSCKGQRCRIANRAAGNGAIFMDEAGDDEA